MSHRRGVLKILLLMIKKYYSEVRDTSYPEKVPVSQQKVLLMKTGIQRDFL